MCLYVYIPHVVILVSENFVSGHYALCFVLKYTFKRIPKLFIILLIHSPPHPPHTECSFKPEGSWHGPVFVSWLGLTGRIIAGFGSQGPCEFLLLWQGSCSDYIVSSKTVAATLNQRLVFGLVWKNIRGLWLAVFLYLPRSTASNLHHHFWAEKISHVKLVVVALMTHLIQVNNKNFANSAN